MNCFDIPTHSRFDYTHGSITPQKALQTTIGDCATPKQNKTKKRRERKIAFLGVASAACSRRGGLMRTMLRVAVEGMNSIRVFIFFLQKIMFFRNHFHLYKRLLQVVWVIEIVVVLFDESPHRKVIITLFKFSWWFLLVIIEAIGFSNIMLRCL